MLLNSHSFLNWIHKNTQWKRFFQFFGKQSSEDRVISSRTKAVARMERERRKSLRITEVRMFKRKRRNLMCNFLRHFSEPSWFGAVKKKKDVHDKYSFFPGNDLGNDAYFVQEKKDAELLYSLLDKKMGSAPYVNLLCWHKSKPVTTPDWSTNWCSVSFSI